MHEDVQPVSNRNSRPDEMPVNQPKDGTQQGRTW
jgi:hypothetical protein